MYDIIENKNAAEEHEWRNFEKTGSIYSYLRYKGIYIENTDTADTADASSASAVRDGEPIGCY